MKKELIFTDEKSNKFWNIEVNGSSFTVNYGKSFTDGTTQTKSFATEELCHKEANKIINEKLKKGYQEMGTNVIEIDNFSMIMKSAEQEKNIKGFNTIDCCVRDRNIFYFVLREDYNLWKKSKRKEAGWNGGSQGPGEGKVEKRILVWFRTDPIDDQWSYGSVTGISSMFGEVCTNPKPKFIGIAGEKVYAIGSGEKGFEKDIPMWNQGGPFQGSANKARRIDGWLYATGGGHCVAKRVSNGEWQSFTKSIPDPETPGSRTTMFKDIDGYSETDIYCAGWGGRVCHFDGNEWKLLDFPTEVDLQSLVCAGDGYVYISGMHGVVFKGRGAKWECIHEGSTSLILGFRDMVWYEDRVWCTSDYGIWTIKDDKLEEADVPSFVRGCAGNLSTADGVLLVAGYGGASFLENGEWKLIY